MVQAFAMAGYDEGRLRAIETRRHLKQLRNRLLQDLVATDPAISVSQPNGHFRPTVSLSGIPLSVHLGFCFSTDHGERRWLIRPVVRERNFVTLIGRLDVKNETFNDYIVLPNLGTRTLWTMSPDDHGLTVGKRLASLSELSNVVNQINNSSKLKRGLVSDAFTSE